MSTLLQLQDVSVSFGGFKAVRDLSLDIKKGELRCLIGPNGAGKTTALDLICGKVQPTGGQIRLGDVNVTDMEDYEIARAGIGRKFQIPSVFKQLTVRENLEVADCRNTGVFWNFFHAPGGSERSLEELAEFVGLKDHLDEPAEYLSHGQTQWLEIALLLAQDADLILLDEPTAGMTAQETRKTAEICLQLRGKHTIIVVEHDMGFVKEIGDVISVMHQGQLLAEGSVAEIEKDKKVREVYLGTSGISHA
ncbi:urea ABC transporter ATP-binding protein UrtD [Notoacmeibacter sp. MSK16QG-6]|uniref:urea ABC transporter ATP-binding protein UrtD n=1 Tax=Notoacmeibacter sp. MSK16QG-6 TaxID=2957982 RepID=UPI00209F382B|nr:urea ABC transporter ATP-binding protein UrtD [Notoacmeibacter sp. MSK16QG-6]